MITKRPICQNPKCSNGAVIFVGTKMFCGDCAMKISAHRLKKETEEMMGVFEDGD